MEDFPGWIRQNSSQIHYSAFTFNKMFSAGLNACINFQCLFSIRFCLSTHNLTVDHIQIQTSFISILQVPISHLTSNDEKYNIQSSVILYPLAQLNYPLSPTYLVYQCIPINAKIFINVADWLIKVIHRLFTRNIPSGVSGVWSGGGGGKSSQRVGSRGRPARPL